MAVHNFASSNELVNEDSIIIQTIAQWNPALIKSFILKLAIATGTDLTNKESDQDIPKTKKRKKKTTKPLSDDERIESCSNTYKQQVPTTQSDNSNIVVDTDEQKTKEMEKNDHLK